MVAPSKNITALNLYTGTNVLVYERLMVVKDWYTASQHAGSTLTLFHTLILCMHASQKNRQTSDWRTHPAYSQ